MTDEEMFRAAGFHERRGGLEWEAFLSAHEGAGDAHAWARVAARRDGDMPDGIWVAEVDMRPGDFAELQMETARAEDVLALSVSMAHAISDFVGAEAASRLPPAPGAPFPRNPFLDERGGWAASSMTDDRILLDDPQDLLGMPYAAWLEGLRAMVVRNGLAAATGMRVLADAPAERIPCP